MFPSSQDLGGNAVGNPGAAAMATALLAQRAVLTDLHMDYNGIGAAGGHSLALALSGSQARCSSDESMSAVNVSLTNLWLHGNEQVSASSQGSINNALRRNRLRIPRMLTAALQRLAGAFPDNP